MAAVFASNFVDHMLTLSKEILEKNSLSFDLLKPLIHETIAARAFELWEKYGRPENQALDNWLQAERELLSGRRFRRSTGADRIV